MSTLPHNHLIDLCDRAIACLFSILFRKPDGIANVFQACYEDNHACILWDDFVTVICNGQEEMQLCCSQYASDVPYYSVLYPH
jgi:hypothetical protein